MQQITEFRGEYAFLSNFYEVPVKYEGMTYPSSEAAFQAMKCEDKSERYRFTNVPAGKAKRFVVEPQKIEYSPKDDKFRIISKVKNRQTILNMAAIKHCRINCLPQVLPL